MVSAANATEAFAEPPSGRAAVESFLAAERDGDSDMAYMLLAAADRDAAGSSQAWAAARPDRANPTGVQVLSDSAGGEGVDVAVAVTRQPSLDPFAGFVSARATQTWRAVQEDGRWRVRAEPVAEQLVLPPLAAATAPAKAWAQALASCDSGGAVRLQAGPQLYGASDLVGTPCRERGVWSAGAPVGVDRGDVQPLLEAYGPDLSSWARLVPVQGPRTKFFVAVAPVGDDWRVIGVTGDGG